MATNFSLNVRRIRDLATLTNMDVTFDPSTSYVLVDAHDNTDKYTTYKMSIQNLSSAISGVIGTDTANAIESRFNEITAIIQTNVETSVVTNVVNAITSQDGFIESISNSISSSISDDIKTDVYNALIANGISTDIATELKNSGIATTIANYLTSDYNLKNNIATTAASQLKTDFSFIQQIVNTYGTSNIAQALIDLPDFETNVAIPLSNELTASPDFIAAVKAAIDALEPSEETDPENPEDPEETEP